MLSVEIREDVAVVVRPQPLRSALHLLLSLRYGAMPPRVRDRLSSGLAPDVLAALATASIGGTQYSFPDSVTPTVEDSPSWAAAAAAVVRDTSPDDLVAELWATYPDSMPASWQKVIHRPRRWMDLIADSLVAVETVLAPLWESAQPRIAVETELLLDQDLGTGTLFALGTLAEFTVTDRHITAQFPLTDTLPTPGVIEVSPMFGATGDWTLSPTRDRLHVGYAMRGSYDAFSRPSRPGPTDTLEVLLGPIRAQLLRLLDQPVVVGKLARRLQRAASTATFHCDHLVEAGLIDTVRVGHHTWIVRTERGTRLIETMKGYPRSPID